MLRMQNKRAACTQVRASEKKKKRERETLRGRHQSLCVCLRDMCVFSCVMVAHFVVYESSLKLFKNAGQSSIGDLMPASPQKG